MTSVSHRRGWLAATGGALVVGGLGCGTVPLSPLAAQGTVRRADKIVDPQAPEVGLSDIVVTARLRSERLQDVPIAVVSESGESLRVRGIERLDALTQTIPNVLVAEGVVSETLQIRGVSGGGNTGFEQPVGQVVDGFFYSRSRLTRVPFLDVARVDVLKGPQGALIGKNTTAGVIVITSARPTKSFEGFAQATYENYPDAGEGYFLEGAVSGPISDTLRARVALRRRGGGG